MFVVIPGWCASTRPGISRFSDVQLHIVVRCCASPRNDMGRGMAGFWVKKSEGSAVSADFRRALTQQVLRTELIRIRALIGTTAVLGLLLLVIHTFDPFAVEHLWHGRLKPTDLYAIMVPFILFELWIHTVINRHLKLDRD